MIAERFKYMPIVAVIIAIVMTVLDGTIMNVALPSLTKEFKRGFYRKNNRKKC